MTKIGTGYVSVDADLSPFWRKLEREIGGGLDSQFKAHGVSAGRSLGNGLATGINTGRLKSLGDDIGKDFSRGVTNGLAPAKRALTGFERDGIASFKAVGNSSRQANAELKTLYASITKQNISRALGDVDKAATRAGDAIQSTSRRGSAGLRALERDSRGAAKGLNALGAGGSGGGLDTLRRNLAGFSSELPGGVAAVGGLRIALVAVVPALLAFGGATVAAGAALIPLAGLAAGAANSLGAAAQGFGVLKLATLGVGAALKEQATNTQKVGGAAATSAGQQRSAARAIQSAQDGVRNALDAVKTATTNVSDAHRGQTAALAALAPAVSAARMRLRDLHDAAKDAGFALLDATGAAKDARTALAALLAGSSPRVLADAHRAVTDALRGEASAARSLDDAHRSVDDALRGETGAVRDLEAAHRALDELLTPATALDLADAEDAVADAVRNEERARLGLADTIASTAAKIAKAENDRAKAQLVLTDPRATADQREQARLQLAFAGDTNATAKARLDLADAENAVGDATRASQHAQENLHKLEAPPDAFAVADARQHVADAELAVAQAARQTTNARQGVADAEYAVGQATVATANAREDLATAEAPASSEEIAKARLAVAEADNSVAEATRDQVRAVRELNTADKLGVNGAQGVVDARDAITAAAVALTNADKQLADAHRGVARATQALGDAQLSANESMTTAAVTAANLNAKLNSLPPAAQAFVKQLISMKPKLDELRQTAAEGFFPGAVEGLKAAEGSFSSVNKVIGETSTVLGEAAKKSGELVGSPAFGKDIETIGGNNAKVIDTLGEALRHVVSALRHVMVAAGPLTQWLADVTNQWALNAAEAAKSGRETGKMAAFFEKTRAICERLGSVIGHLAHGLLGVGEAGSKSGNDIWASIDRASKRFDSWANSTKGQKAIHEFFTRATALADALIPVLAGVAGAIAMITLKGLPLTQFLKLVGPYTDEATAAFIAFKVAGFAAGAASKALAAAIAIANFATGGWATSFWALNAAFAANPIVLTVAAVVALGAAIYLAYKKFETFRNIVDAVLGAVKSAFNWIKDNWSLLATILTGPFGIAVREITKHWGDITAGAQKVLDFVTGVFGGLLSIGSAVVDGIVDGIKAAAQGLLNAGSWILNQIVTGFQAVTALLGGVGSWLFDRIRGFVELEITGLKNIGSWLLNRIVDGFKVVTDLLGTIGGWIRNRIAEVIHNEIAGLAAIGGWILNRLVDGFKVVTDLLGTVGGWIRNRISDFIHNELDGLGAIGGWILNRLVDGFKTITEGLSSVGGWLKNRIADIVDLAKDGFTSVGGSIIGFIVDGLKAGGKQLLGFVNDIINVINKLLGAIGVDEIAPISAKSVGLAQGGKHFARGGITEGGFVNRPIVMMGEEAPQFPEWVIPTNPAYRKRAQMLLAQAADSIGLASGGKFSQKDMENLWAKHGGGDKEIAGAVGMGESGGNPNASNGPYHGLWQIGPGGSFNPDRNAIQGIAKWRAGGDSVDARWKPWEAYTGPDGVGNDGPWRNFMGGGGGILGAITGAIGAVGGLIGDLLSKGAGFLLDKLPGVGELPKYLEGTGKWLLNHATDWIKDKVSGLVSDNTPSSGVEGLGIFDGRSVADWIIPELTYARHHGWRGPITSGYRSPDEVVNSPVKAPQGKSEHQGTQYPHGAVDFGGPFDAAGLANKRAFMHAAAGYAGHKLRNPIGFRDDGHASGTGHYMGGILGALSGPWSGTTLDSYAEGTPFVKTTGPYELHRGEAVIPAAMNTAGLPTTIHVYLGTREISDIVDVQIERDGRRTKGAWNAGVIS